MEKTVDRIRHNVLPVVAALIWGTAFVAQEAAAEHVQTFTVNTVRSFLSVLALLAVIGISSLATKKKRMSEPPKSAEERKKSRRLLLIGGLCCGTALFAAQSFQQFGFSQGADAGKAGFITALYIVIVPLFGLLFRKKVSLKIWIGLGIAVAGFYLLCVKKGFTLEISDLLILISAVCFSVHILVIDRFTHDVDGVKLSCAQFAVCTVLSAAAMLIFEKPSVAEISAAWLPLVYLGVFSSGIGYTLQIVSQKGANPAVVSLLLSLESVFAAITSAVILGKSLEPREYIGCALIFAAVVLTQLPEFGRRKKNG